MVTVLVLCLLSLAFGCVPFGRIMMVLFANAQMDSHGTANIPPMLIWQTGRHRLALATAALECAKCALPLALISSLSTPPYAVPAAFLCCLMGHTFSPFCAFRPTLGIAPLFGGVLVFAPTAASLSGALWLFIVLVDRRPTLASLAVAFSLPIILFAVGASIYEMIAATTALPLILFVYRRQFDRLIKGKEPAWF